MSTIFFNLFNELGKNDKMQGLSNIVSLFNNEFNKLKNTKARMLDSFYHITLKLLWNSFCHIYAWHFMVVIT